jgi:hypothetical protein
MTPHAESRHAVIVAAGRRGIVLAPDLSPPDIDPVARMDGRPTGLEGGGAPPESWWCGCGMKNFDNAPACGCCGSSRVNERGDGSEHDADAVQVACSRLIAPEDHPLSDKSARAIRDVLNAAREQFMNEPEWEVTATVVTRLRAADKAAAMQELCNRLDHGVPDSYGVATVEATDVGPPAKDLTS